MTRDGGLGWGKSILKLYIFYIYATSAKNLSINCKYYYRQTRRRAQRKAVTYLNYPEPHSKPC